MRHFSKLEVKVLKATSAVHEKKEQVLLYIHEIVKSRKNQTQRSVLKKLAERTVDESVHTREHVEVFRCTRASMVKCPDA